MKIHSLGKLTEGEQTLIKAAVPELDANIQKVHLSVYNIAFDPYLVHFRVLHLSKRPNSRWIRWNIVDLKQGRLKSIVRTDDHSVK